jgi:endonuclease III
MARAKRAATGKKPSGADLRRRAVEVVRALERAYPDAECALQFRNPFELLVATILSAQCTDVMVNRVTPGLFARFHDAKALAAAPLAEVEEIVRPTGFFRTKAKNLVAMSAALVERHGGTVPQDLAALTALPGVGRKTANVVLGTAFGIASGVVVDTHVKRLVFRLGLTALKDPTKIERCLMDLLPDKEWVMFSHRLIWHGRKVCVASRPWCSKCALEPLCAKQGVMSAR